MAFGLNKEIGRRANQLIAIADAEGHGNLRIGGGWRSDARAYSEFFRRYAYVGLVKPPAGPLGSVKYFSGDMLNPKGWYVLRPHEIACATPGNSYHTTCPPDALTGDTGAVAIDWVNELGWMQANCHRVGLKSFQHVPGEGHHTQPVEYPNSRSNFKPAIHKMTVYPGFDAPPAPNPSPYPPSVRLGDRNPTVTLLQTKLGITADGWFGPKTELAVKAFQKANGLTVDGWVGPQTWKKLGF